MRSSKKLEASANKKTHKSLIVKNQPHQSVGFFISPGKVTVLSDISPNYDFANVSVIDIPVDF